VQPMNVFRLPETPVVVTPENKNSARQLAVRQADAAP
jgi:hypothetical protein